MHITRFLPIGLTALAFAACASPRQSTASTRARITRAQAEALALKSVPDGGVKQAELEEENGRLVWSFDLTRPHTNNITEIQIDARSGKVVRREIESPSQQALEAAKERAVRN
jgi:hypothetical protein